MILDSRTEFCNATAVNTGAAGTYLVGNQVDLTKARDIGVGEPLYLVILVATAIAAAATGTLTFALASDSTAAVSTSTSTRHLTTPTFDAAAGIPAGTVLFAGPLPMEGNAYEQFLGILQITGAAAASAGAIDAFLVRDVAKWKAYPDGI